MKASVYLALPTHGRPEGASTYSALLHATANRFNVHVVSRECSLLAHGFNQAWVEFDRGGFGYFAMLHSDVAASRFWLDTLVEEMGKRFGVMHAPVRMKDDRELTSTALGHMDRPFDLCRRIALKELHSLPPTFGYREAAAAMKCQQDGWALLPNTGCFVVDRTRVPLHLFTGFEIRSVIVKGPNGPEAVVESEDWGFGRWCARQGIEVGATSKVKTRHFGMTEYSTDVAERQEPYEQDLDYKYSLKGHPSRPNL